jgi:hypothetical protein
MQIVERWSPKKQAQEVEAFHGRLGELGREGWEMISSDTVPLTGSSPATSRDTST